MLRVQKCIDRCSQFKRKDRQRFIESGRSFQSFLVLHEATPVNRGARLRNPAICTLKWNAGRLSPPRMLLHADTLLY